MNWLNFGWSSKSSQRKSGAHMTFAHATINRSLSRTAVILRRQLWIWPLIAIAVLSIVGFSVRFAIERTMKRNLSSQLETLLGVEVSMIKNWARNQTLNAEALANDARLREQVYTLLRLVEDDSAPQATSGAGEQKFNAEQVRRELRQLLGPAMNAHDYFGYFVVNRGKQILAASQESSIGRQSVAEYHDFLERALDGQPVILPPFLSPPETTSGETERVRDVPTMYVFAPIRDESFQVVAVLALRINPEREFTQIMHLGRIGESGETYAFNSTGVMISNSRFDQDLILIGVLPDDPHSRSILTLPLRDPGQDITVEGRPRRRRADMPYTKMAAVAIAGTNGVDVEGYRDYRGVLVVGAWNWLPDMNIGIATEIDHAEAFHPLTILQTAFWVMYGLLTVAAIAIFVFTIIVARLRREAQKAAMEAKELGQYQLEHKIGAGAMGVVYRAVHSMLRRPTAIKMLNVEKVTDDSIKRFEHEVQITCQLNHPNTIAIFDYGRTPEGVFYYAMEYLDGIDLQQLVEKYGPLPEARVIHILRQICGSLYEAHSKGLVHRDIKPSNIMLNRRGGEADVVKVLDFGLVKAVNQKEKQQLSSANSLAGTPLYMSPEAIQSPILVDACSDLYAVGAVGYFLLTGQPVFNSATIVELLQQHVTSVAVAPSIRLGRIISEELEHAILACLEKNRANRPQTARLLSQLLSRASNAKDWTQDNADAWWGRHERGVAPGKTSTTNAAPPVVEQTMISNPEIDQD